MYARENRPKHRLHDGVKERIHSIVSAAYPRMKLGQCVEINGTVGKALRAFLGDPYNERGYVYIVQGKVQLDREITDFYYGEKHRPFKTSEPDHVYLGICDPPLAHETGVLGAIDKWIDGCRSPCRIWDFAQHVFWPAEIEYYRYPDDILGYSNISHALYSKLKAVIM